MMDKHRPRFIGLRFTVIVIRNRHRCFEVSLSGQAENGQRG